MPTIKIRISDSDQISSLTILILLDTLFNSVVWIALLYLILLMAIGYSALNHSVDGFRIGQFIFNFVLTAIGLVISIAIRGMIRTELE